MNQNPKFGIRGRFTIGIVACLIVTLGLYALHTRHIAGAVAGSLHPIVNPIDWNKDSGLTFISQASGAQDAELNLYAHRKTQNLGKSVNSFGWNPSGRLLLYSKPDPDFPYLGRLMIYDKLRKTSHPVHYKSEVTWSACWIDNNTLCYFTRESHPKNSLASDLVRETLPSGTSQRFAIPNGLIPLTLKFSKASGVVLFDAVGYPPSQIQLAIFRNGVITAVPGTMGCSAEYAVDPVHPRAVVVQRYPNGVSIRLDMINLTESNPVPHPLLLKSRIPQAEWLSNVRFSPDGSKIALVAEQNSEKKSIYLYDLATDTLSLMVDGQKPIFSPDGTRIVYGKEPAALQTCNLHGADVKQLASVH